MWKWNPSNSGTFLAAVRQAVSTVAGSSRQPSSIRHTKEIYSAYITYNEQAAKWEETYGEKTAPKAETFDERLQRYQREAKKQYIDKNYHNKDKGAK